jgi:hypothetical protein
LRFKAVGHVDRSICVTLVARSFDVRRLRAARRMWRALPPGGALVIGAKERLKGEELRLFAPWPGASAVYRRRSAGDAGPG